MPRIPDALIESIKRDVSCVAVLEARGLEFVAHGGGGDVVCRCPFHDDRTPSLIVSVAKNLWRCHGACGVGGDVIALIQKLNGVSFRHAVELASSSYELPAASCELDNKDKQSASSFAAGSAADAASGERKKPVKYNSARLLPCPLDGSVDDARLMQQVVDFYAGRLVVPGNAGRAYLAERGLDDGELIRRFALGFSDRSLGLRLPNKLRKEGAELRQRLERLGLFRSSGHEHFAGSVVVPIHGDDGAVSGMYGRKVTERLRSGTPVHTYLPGKHRGIWNAGPGLVNADGAVVICEAVLDALSCWVAGMRNVTAAYGVNGFTDDHWSALTVGKARDVFIAFDADAAGDVAAERLAEQLICRGFTAFRVRFPADQDANAVLMAKDGGRAALAALIHSAEWLGGSPRVIVPEIPKTASAAKEESSDASSFAAAVPAVAASLPKGVSVRRDGADLFATLGTRTYRVRGWQGKKSGETLTVALRVSVMTAQGERQHHDRLDLYQTRQRVAFVSAAAEECGLSVEVLKSDLGTLILVAEAAEVAAANAAASVETAQNPADAMTDADKAAALELLRAADLPERIVNDLTRCGLVGETINKLVAYLASSSRKLDSPVAVVVQSSTAAGKSTLMDRVLALMPPEDVRQYSAISGKSPFYLGTANLKHRILAIAEEEGARKASYALKLLQSDGFLSMAATGKDPESGKLVTHDYRVEGPVMLMLTTTAIDVDPELLNRCLVLTVDEEPAQTAAIQQAQREGRTLAGMNAKRERVLIEVLHQNAQRLLRPLAVVNPFATQLSFAASQTRLRRDHAKYLAMIDAVTFLFQHQRIVKTNRFADGSTMDYIEVTPADIALANTLATAVLGRCVDELPPQTRVLWDGLLRYAQDEAQRCAQAVQSVTFDRRAAAQALGWSYKQVRQHLDRLVSEDFVVVMASGMGQVTRYRLVDGLTAAGRLDLRLGNEKSPMCTMATLPMKTPTLPIKMATLPIPCPWLWAGSNDGQKPSFGAIFRGVPRFSISRGGDISAKITSYMQIADADENVRASAS
jgi:DNA primase